MVMIDDATNRTYARFYEAQALDVDHDSIYERTRDL